MPLNETTTVAASGGELDLSEIRKVTDASQNVLVQSGPQHIKRLQKETQQNQPEPPQSNPSLCWVLSPWENENEASRHLTKTGFTPCLYSLGYFLYIYITSRVGEVLA